MAKSTHIHKLKRLRYKSGNTIFFCCLPDCSFKTNVALALGKRSICWRCNSDFILSEYALRLAKPHCENCHKPKIDLAIPGTLDERVVTGENQPFLSPAELTLSERLQRLLHKPKEQEEEL
jgi:hypothetical protein